MDVEKKKDEKQPMHLAESMTAIIRQLEKGKKRPAMHTYKSTLNSFRRFSDEELAGAEMSTGKAGIPASEAAAAEMPTDEVFTPGRLKEYEEWLRQKKAKWNTVSTYMRTLQAVYNRLYPPGSVGHDLHLFDDVYTKVESLTKRALAEEQMRTLLTADFTALPPDVQCALAYFLLMFLFRGMPFIDLAYLRRQDVKGDYIVYCRHKTGRQITMRIPPEAQRLFDEYRNKNSDSVFLFPILDGNLKTEGELHACYLKMLRDFNKRLEKIAALLLPGVKISSYTARHTWATLAFHQGVSVGLISKALGHSSIKVTETYLKAFENEKVDTANDELIIAVVKPDEGRKVA